MIPNSSLQSQIKFPLTDQKQAPSIAIGGVGGSGTRLVAGIMQSAGISMGGDLNGPLDNLWYTLLFKQPGILSIDDDEFERRLRAFIAANYGLLPLSDEEEKFIHALCDAPRPQQDRAWLLERYHSAIRAAARVENPSRWGWKEPNTHICIDRLAKYLPNMKYIHVARSGLDMAFSGNLFQLEFWGKDLTGEQGDGDIPSDALRYWCASHKRVFNIAETLGPRFMFLKFEDLCSNPEEVIPQLLEFVDIQGDDVLISQLLKLVNPPDTIGRYRQHDLTQFNPADIEYVNSLGYPTHL